MPRRRRALLAWRDRAGGRAAARPGAGAARAPALALALALALPGCGWGYLYTNITTPLDVNVDATPAAQPEEELSTKTLEYVIRVDWGTNAIGDIARKYKIETVHSADLEQTYVLFGLWRQAWVHIRGERAEPAEDAP